MDRRKFIQTGIAGVAGLSLVRTGKDRIESLSYSYGNRDERLELPVQSDPARTG